MPTIRCWSTCICSQHRWHQSTCTHNQSHDTYLQSISWHSSTCTHNQSHDTHLQSISWHTSTCTHSQSHITHLPVGLHVVFVLCNHTTQTQRVQVDRCHIITWLVHTIKHTTLIYCYMQSITWHYLPVRSESRKKTISCITCCSMFWVLGIRLESYTQLSV